MVPPTGPIPIWVQYDGTKKVKGLLKRVKKRFANGLSREAKNFYLKMAREGRRPKVLAEKGLVPVFGPGSKAEQAALAEYKAREAADKVRERAEERLTEEGLLFDNTAPGLPD